MVRLGKSASLGVTLCAGQAIEVGLARPAHKLGSALARVGA